MSVKSKARRKSASPRVPPDASLVLKAPAARKTALVLIAILLGVTLIGCGLEISARLSAAARALSQGYHVWAPALGGDDRLMVKGNMAGGFSLLLMPGLTNLLLGLLGFFAAFFCGLLWLARNSWSKWLLFCCWLMLSSLLLLAPLATKPLVLMRIDGQGHAVQPQLGAPFSLCSLSSLQFTISPGARASMDYALDAQLGAAGSATIFLTSNPDEAKAFLNMFMAGYQEVCGKSLPVQTVGP